ncbi:hypothetical protein [Runella zeae]|uniref:hypothetical protein n=1 Tax=Runella zeae TaxID=94255 RepID=UPI000418150A|nr:hypothetical protein [Runella zeae]
MHNSQPNLSAKQIKNATLLALISAVVIGVVAVLPAQYGKDYTGLGKILGFSRLYVSHQVTEAKATQTNGVELPPSNFLLAELGSDAKTPKPKEAELPAPAQQYESRMDSVKIAVPAGKGLEYKILVLKHGQVKYDWKTDKGILFFDLHGDVKENAAKNSGYYESYTVGNSNNLAGSFIAPYEGKHGWYFKNRTNEEIIVNLHVKGEYQMIEDQHSH